MEIKCIAGFSVITKQPAASASLYQQALGLPLERFGDDPDYLNVDLELADASAVEAAVQELKAKGQDFIHEVRTEPWGQITARFMSPEGVLVSLSYAPWLHD